MYLRVNSENERRNLSFYIISNNSQNKDWRVERIIEKERKFFRITIYDLEPVMKPFRHKSHFHGPGLVDSNFVHALRILRRWNEHRKGKENARNRKKKPWESRRVARGEELNLSYSGDRMTRLSVSIKETGTLYPWNLDIHCSI